MNVENVQRETVLATQVSKPAGPRISHPQAWLLPRTCQLGSRRHGRFGNLRQPWRGFHAVLSQPASAAHRHACGGMSEKKAFLLEQSHLDFSKNRSKWLVQNNLRAEKTVVKKRQFEKQSHFGLPQMDQTRNPAMSFNAKAQRGQPQPKSPSGTSATVQVAAPACL
jgi:hypothetical protein